MMMNMSRQENKRNKYSRSIGNCVSFHISPVYAYTCDPLKRDARNFQGQLSCWIITLFHRDMWILRIRKKNDYFDTISWSCLVGVVFVSANKQTNNLNFIFRASESHLVASRKHFRFEIVRCEEDDRERLRKMCEVIGKTWKMVFHNHFTRFSMCDSRNSHSHYMQMKGWFTEWSMKCCYCKLCGFIQFSDEIR